MSSTIISLTNSIAGRCNGGGYEGLEALVIHLLNAVLTMPMPGAVIDYHQVLGAPSEAEQRADAYLEMLNETGKIPGSPAPVLTSEEEQQEVKRLHQITSQVTSPEV